MGGGGPGGIRGGNMPGPGGGLIPEGGGPGPNRPGWWAMFGGIGGGLPGGFMSP